MNAAKVSVQQRLRVANAFVIYSDMANDHKNSQEPFIFNEKKSQTNNFQ